MRGCLPGCGLILALGFLALALGEAVVHMPAIVWGDWLALFGAAFSVSLGAFLARAMVRRVVQ